MNWELKFMEWGHGWWTLPVLDDILPWGTHLGSLVAVILFILLSWILTRRKRVLGLLTLLYGLQSVMVYGLKFLIQRQRPFVRPEITSALTRGPGEVFDPSFPSAHAACAFMMATLLAYWFPRYRIPFFLIAALIGWSRIYLGMHYPTDVVAGGLIGYGITRLYLHWVPLSSHRPQTKGETTPSSAKESE